jgi:HTH-type transcriptional regulator/antitoxin HipB
MIGYVIQHPQQLASLLKAMRNKSGLTQAQVAARLGISHQAVSALEKRPETATLERLMRMLGVLQVDLVLRSRPGPSTPTPTPTPTPTEW